jgi:hypothetical protein
MSSELTWTMPKFRVRSKGRFEPLEIQISRQTDAIEKHEKIISDHAKIQSFTNILTLVFSVVTTAALIYIAYQQYNVSQWQTELAERQTSLEYAKVAPQFLVVMETFPTVTSGAIENKVPQSLIVRVKRGEGVIQRIQVYQDFLVSGIFRKQSEIVHANCQIRSNNYFRVAEDLSKADASPSINKIAIDPVFHYPDIGGDFFLIKPQGTYAVIEYEDVFGDTQKQVFSGTAGHLQKLPKPQLPQDGLYEIVEAGFLRGNADRFPAYFDGRGVKPKSDGCKIILQKSAVSLR